MNEKPFEPADLPNWIACIRAEIRVGVGHVTCPAYPLLELLEELEKARAAALPATNNCWLTAENR